MPDTLEFNQVLFLTYGIECASEEIGLSASKVYELMDECGVVDFVLDSYDVLHTQSIDYLVEVILDIIN